MTDGSEGEVGSRNRKGRVAAGVNWGGVMITSAQLIVDRAEAGEPVSEEFAKLPAYQLRERFEDLAPLCPSRLCLPLERRPANALNVEIGAPLPRCIMRSPDGRGSAWLLSGGSPLAYGTCDRSRCPRLVTPSPTPANHSDPNE